MSFFKQTISKFMATSLALTFLLPSAGAIPPKELPKKQNNHVAAKVLTGGAALIGLTFLATHYWPKTDSSGGNDVNATKKSVKINNLNSLVVEHVDSDNIIHQPTDDELALLVQAEFIGKLNSYPTKEDAGAHTSAPNAAFPRFLIKPISFVTGITCLLPAHADKLQEFGAPQPLDDVVSLTPENITDLQQYLIQRLSYLYQITSERYLVHEKIYDFATLQQYYFNIARNGTWKTDCAKRVYLDLFDYYCLFGENKLEYDIRSEIKKQTTEQRRQNLITLGFEPNEYPKPNWQTLESSIKWHGGIVIRGSRRVVDRRDNIFKPT